MKGFRIKKKTERRHLYIPGEPITYFKKPKLPFVFISKVNKPALYKPKFNLSFNK